MTFHERLKQATAAEHHGAEQATRMLDPALSVAGYVQCLKKLYGFYRPMEVLLVRWIEAQGIDWKLTERAGKLCEDLQGLGLTAPAIECLEICAYLPDLTRAAEGLGAIYVVEGSVLGGRVIGRHLDATLGLTAANGASFFAVPDSVGLRWQGFRALIEAAATDPVEEGLIIGGARQTFEAYRAWMAADV